jgi:HEAT repeat protein
VSDVTPPEAKPIGAPTEVPEERQTTPFLVLQFFIFPMAIVAVCVTVFVIFGLISSSPRTPREYLAEARTGGGMFNIKRWQAAFSLANALESPKDLEQARHDPGFVDDVLALYRDTSSGQGDDPLLRRYLALALGRLGDKRAVPELRRTLQQGGADTQTLIYAAWALGAIGDPDAMPELLALSHHEDSGLRKAAIHALGSFPSDEAQQTLRQALNDATEDVRWNAAVALGRHRDAAAAPVLATMLDRSHLTAVPGFKNEKGATDDEAIEGVMVEAVRAASVTPDASLGAALEKLRDGDRSLKVREEARLALERRRN